MNHSQRLPFVVFLAGMFLLVVPFYAAFADVGRGSSLWSFREALLLAVVPGTLLLVHGFASIRRERVRSLTPAVTWAVPIGVAVLFLLETATPDMTPIDSLGSGTPPPPEPWWQGLLGALNPKLTGASIFVVTGVATRRREWRWLALAFSGVVLCALVGAAYISGRTGSGFWPPAGHIAWRALADIILLGSIPLLWGFGFAAPRE